MSTPKDEKPMSSETDPQERARRAVAALQQANQKIVELRSRANEPIAIVATAGRYPGGADTPEELWRLVAEGRDAVGEFPENRPGWSIDELYDPDPDVPGRSLTKEGGFLDDVDLFDPAFFGISPKEAERIDPQQRILLETCWELLERARVPAASLRDSPTGVYVGAMYDDYFSRLGRDLINFDGHNGTAGGHSILSGRLSYTLGLRGPAISVDTACSSSLVTIHMAMEALRKGECDLALAGGVAVMATPFAFVEFSRQRGLAPDGRCKPFSELADGAGWSEGCGMLLLERLSDARAHGHEVLAVLRSGAVNQDGRSQGLTAPNGPSQERVIRAALESAELGAADVDAVEAHGTGTPLGDPIEANALGATYGQAHTPERPLLVGSIKSNLGHTQAAAGVAGVIKMVQALRHEELPRSLYAESPSSHVDWSSGQVRLLDEAVSWPRREGHVRRAGVSSFGISGTNAHVILEEAPAEQLEHDGDVRLPSSAASFPFVLSGHTESALRANAARLAEFVAPDRTDSDEPTRRDAAALRDIAYSTVTTRTPSTERVCLPARDVADAVPALRSVADGSLPSGAVRAAASRERVVWVFPGQGGQHPGMCRSLLGDEVFRAALVECDGALRPYTGFSVVELLESDEESQREALDRVTVVQPVLFAVGVALARVWRHWGVVPSAVVGHSQGEVAAAVVAGVLSVAEGARVVGVRSRLVAGLAGDGGMGSVSLPVAQVRRRLAEWGGALSVAVVNTAESTVVAGDRQELEEFLAVLEGEGVSCRRIKVDYASHSPQVDPVLESVRSELADLAPTTGDVPVVSTVRGARVDGSELDGDYWADNLRQPVRLDLALEELSAGEETVLVELGAHPMLVATLRAAGHEAVVGSLHRDEDGASRLRQAAAELFAHGIPIDWDTVYAGTNTQTVDLPTYAFQRQHYWLELPAASQGDASAFGLDAGEHPLLAGRTDLSDGTVVFTGSTAALARPWNSEHHVFDTALLPTTTLIDLALHAASRVGLERVAETSVEEPIPLDAGPRRLRLVIEPEQDGRRGFTLQSSFADGPWVRNANGRLAERTTETHPAPDSGPPPGATPLDVEELYVSLDEDGHRYGPAFRAITRGWSTGDEVVVEASLPDELRDESETFGTHPALLEAALTAATRLLPNTDEAVHLPCTVTDAMRHAVGATTIRARVNRTSEGRVRLALFDPADDPVATIGAITTEEVTEPRVRESAGSGATTASSALYHVVGQPVPAPATDPPRGAPTDHLEVDIAAPGDSTPDFAALADRVRTAEASTLVVRWPEPDATPAAVHELTHRALAWLRGWLAADALGDTRVVWLTHRATGHGSAQSPSSPAARALWGIARAFQQEHPDRHLVLVDTETEADRQPAALADLVARLPGDEPQLVLRDGALQALRLLPVERSEEPAATTWNTDGTALITGGTGGLARVLAHHLIAEHGIRHLALVSRSGAAATGSAELVAELEAAGATTVTLHACDVSDRAELGDLLDAIPAERPLTAVFHTAAVLDDGLLADLTPERVDTVLRPKIDAAFHLHELTAELPLSAFVLFSSAAGTLGSAGQANYAAANAALDSLAARRRHTGLPAVSLAWGMWTDVGLVTGLDDPLRHRLGRMGGLPITPEFGMRLLDEALGRPEADLAPIPFDHGRLEQRAKEGALPALLRGLVRPRFRRAAGTATGTGLAERLAGRSESERATALLELVRGELATVLGLPEASAVPVDRPVRDLGLDSLMAVESRNRLAALVGEKLPASLLFDHPTPTELSRFLASKLPGTEPGRARTDVPTTRRAPDEPIAVVSMAGRYPGGVDSPEGLWRLLVDGGDAVSGFPDRPGWDVAGLFDPDPDAVGRTSTDQGGFLYDAGLFDAGFFGVSPREAERLDPQQRLLLETSWEVIERAGLPPSSLDRSLTGVYLGIQSSGYVLHSGDPDQLDGHVATGVANSTASGRLSYTLGLRGPAVSVDTACSSSLVSIHQAMEALRRGECDLAFAGGVTVMATPVPFIAFSQERLISPDGRCKPFSDAADGVGWSEGCGMLLLERLSDARANERDVLAVLRSSALNQDGRSQGLTAPNGPAQERVIGAALAAGGLEPSDVDAVEAHGTGTALGDPMEANALLATYGQGRDAERPLRIGSIKSNLGHPQAAAGVAGVMKMVLALRHGELPRSLYAEEPTSDVDWSAGPVRLLDEAVSWPVESGRVRRAGVSSFGISGTNAHVILEEAPELEISGSGSSVVEVGESA
ncbi:Acyl transferase domain-containing protein, partial [Actinopolyspora mzabensis]